jgi:ribosomal protein S18 acetylase RimI-like enzyme
MIKIELAEINDLDDIMKMIHNCANDLISKNIFQWNETYPSREVFLTDIKKKNLYIFKKNSLIKGCLALSYNKDMEYNDVKWLTKDDKNLYVHRLAVDPKFQKKGIGRLLMDFAEDYARDNKLKSVRLDTFSRNERNNRFYKSRKYIQLDVVYFPNQSEFPFHCYEKILD